MKFKIILVVSFFVLVSSIKANRIVDIYRKNGFCGFYNNVEQVYMGSLNGADWWTLTCIGPGTNRCKMHYIYGIVTLQDEIAVAEDNLLGDLMDNTETDEISNGNTTGQVIKHYQSTLSDNSVADIYITLSWAPDPNDSGNTLFHARITNSLD
jgi:hypothetical protein